MIKKILIILLIAFVVIQFMRPEKNLAEGTQPNDITTVHNTPPEVEQILTSVCYDCHSNHTDYPWYFNIQPFAWWLSSHIKEGKRHLNFSEFATYSAKKQAHKFEEIAELVESKEMPLKSYTWMHKEARLTAEERELVIDWAEQLQKQIGAEPSHEEHEH